MKNFKSFIQLDEVERVKYKDGIANKMAYANDGVKDKGHGRLDNKQEFGEGDAYDKDVKTSPKPHDKEAAAQRAKLAALAARKAMMTNKMSEAESHQSKTTMKHIDNPNAAEKEAAKDIKPGIPGIRDRFAMLDAAKKRGALKEDDLAARKAQKEREKAVDDSLKRKLAAKLRDRAFRLGADHDRTPQGKPPTEHPGFPDASHIDFAGRIKKHAQEREKAMKDREALKKEDFDLLSDLYDQLDENNQEIFLNQLEEDVEVLLAFAKTIAEE